MNVFKAFYRHLSYHFNSLLLIFITEFCSEILSSCVSHFVETSCLTFIATQLAGWHIMQDHLKWRISEQLLEFFFSSRVRYFNDSFSFENSEVFNVTSFYMYCFYSSFNCSFVVFGSFRSGIVLHLLLMHSLKKVFEQTEI